MDENNEYETLFIDEEYEPVLTEDEARQLKPILQDFIRAYVKNSRKDVKEWLPQKIHEHLPEKTEREAEVMADEIIASVAAAEENKKSLEAAKGEGQTREAWISKQALNATAKMSQKEAVQYLAGLDDAIVQSNEAMYKTVTTNAGNISQNPHLDGFIAERQHVETFNLNAKARGSEYRAEVLEPGPGERYGKNSVDIVIKDGSGKVVKRYQSKYCKDANATDQAFKNGDYRGQQKLVPKGQEGEISSKTTTKIEAPDGTSSEPLSKQDAKEMQEEIQNGELPEFDWDNYSVKDLAAQAGKQAGVACLQGAVMGVGFDMAHKLFNGEEIDAEEEVVVALESGVDFGVKTATASALKIGSEKGILKFIPKGTPAATIANIAFVGIEDVKILLKVAAGDLTPREGMEKMADATASIVGGLAAMEPAAAAGSALGAKAGLAIGAAFGPAGVAVGLTVGPVIGGFIGGTLGFMAGSAVGQAVCNAAKKVAKVAVNVVKIEWNKIKEGAKKIANNARRIFGAVKNLFA